jgi:hypothetical protein
MEMIIPSEAEGADEIWGRMKVVDPITCELPHGCLSLDLKSKVSPFRVLPSEGNN